MNPVDKILSIQALKDRLAAIEKLIEAITVRGEEVLELRLAVIGMRNSIAHLEK